MDNKKIIENLDLTEFSKLTQKERNEFYDKHFDQHASSLPWSKTATTLADIRHMVGLFENAHYDRITYFRSFFVERMVEMGHMDKIKSVYPYFQEHKRLTEWIFKNHYSKVKSWLKYVSKEDAYSCLQRYIHHMSENNKMSTRNSGKIPTEFMTLEQFKSIVNFVKNTEAFKRSHNFLYENAVIYLLSDRENILRWLMNQKFAIDLDKDNRIIGRALDKIVIHAPKVTPEFKASIYKKMVKYGFNFDASVIGYYNYYNEKPTEFNRGGDIRIGFSHRLADVFKYDLPSLTALLKESKVSFIDKEIKYLNKSIKDSNKMSKEHYYYPGSNEKSKEMGDKTIKGRTDAMYIIFDHFRTYGCFSEKVLNWRENNNEKTFKEKAKAYKKAKKKEEDAYEKKLKKFIKLGKELGFPEFDDRFMEEEGMMMFGHRYEKFKNH
jgi:hypothetical protein